MICLRTATQTKHAERQCRKRNDDGKAFDKLPAAFIMRRSATHTPSLSEFKNSDVTMRQIYAVLMQDRPVPSKVTAGQLLRKLVTARGRRLRIRPPGQRCAPSETAARR